MRADLRIAILSFMALVVPPVAAKDPANRTSPAEVVRQYCQFDMNGARLSSQSLYADKIDALVTWPVEPGWDSAVLVGGFIVVRAHPGQHISNVAVRYTVLGQMAASRVTAATHPGGDLVTFVLVKSGNEWKIKRPLIPPHVSIQAAASNLRSLLNGEKDPQRRNALEHALGVLNRLQHVGQIGTSSR